MHEAWFPAQWAPYFSLLSLTAIVSVVEVYARRGEHRRLVTSIYLATTLLGLGFLLAASAALVSRQPWHVWYSLGICGLVIFPVCAFSLSRIQKMYRDAELRRSVASDL